MKPVELVARAIANSSQAGELAYDPFMGSGTTLVAAEQTGRLCYGCEIEPKYVAVALERLSQMGLEPRLADD
jgi:DNA modification methylase